MSPATKQARRSIWAIESSECRLSATMIMIGAELPATAGDRSREPKHGSLLHHR